MGNVIGRSIAGGLLGFAGGTLLLLLGGIGSLIWWIIEGLPTAAPLLEILTFASLYILGATGSGVLAGILFSQATTRIGAALVGIVAIQPFLWGIAMMSQLWDGPGEPGEQLITWIIMSLIFGPVIGLTWIRPYHRR
jgi:hypothetical protein